MYLAIMAGKFAKQDVREWCPSTTRPVTRICDKPGIKGIFKWESEGGYAMWAEENIMERNKKSGVGDSNSYTDGHCDIIWAKAGCGVWGLCHVFENTLYLNHDLMEDSVVASNPSIPKVPEPDWAATSARAKKGPKPGEHVQLFRMERGNKGFYSEKCQLETSIALCFEWASYLVPRHV